MRLPEVWNQSCSLVPDCRPRVGEGGRSGRNSAKVTRCLDWMRAVQRHFYLKNMTLEDLRDDEGVFSSIKTLREYDRLVRAGFVRASQIYAGQGILIPTLADFRSAHTEIFAGVSAEAGRIRDEDCLVEIFGSVLEACDLEEEFQLLGKQLRQMVRKVKTVQDCVVIVAFTHGRIVAVQPALMGNKRTAMCLSLAQIRYLFPIITTLNPFSINAYYEALARTVEGRADQLNQIFGQIIGIPGPFSRAPFPARRQRYAESKQRFTDIGMERFSPYGNRLAVLIER